MKFLFTILTIFTSLVAEQYCAISKFTGETCNSYLVFESCKQIDIYAVRGKDGQFFEIKKCWDNVDEYKSHKGHGLCIINTKIKSMGIFGKALESTFYTKNTNGKLEEININFLAFECEKK